MYTSSKFFQLKDPLLSPAPPLYHKRGRPMLVPVFRYHPLARTSKKISNPLPQAISLKIGALSGQISQEYLQKYPFLSLSRRNLKMKQEHLQKYPLFSISREKFSRDWSPKITPFSGKRGTRMRPPDPSDWRCRGLHCEVTMGFFDRYLTGCYSF